MMSCIGTRRAASHSYPKGVDRWEMPRRNWQMECLLELADGENMMTETQTTLAQIVPTLPLSMDAAKSEAVPVILLVEDDRLVREATANILEFGGYRVLRTRNAYEARTEFHRYGEIVRLLITDVVLPGQNGLDLARELRSGKQDLRVLFISGFPENTWTREHREGEALYLEKPFSAESLMHEVRRALLDFEEVAI